MRAAPFCLSGVMNTVPHKLGPKKGKKKKREYVQGSQDEITKTETHREADHAEQKEIWFLYSIWNRDGTGVASVRAFCLILLTTTVLREAT